MTTSLLRRALAAFLAALISVLPIADVGATIRETNNELPHPTRPLALPESPLAVKVIDLSVGLPAPIAVTEAAVPPSEEASTPLAQTQLATIEEALAGNPPASLEITRAAADATFFGARAPACPFHRLLGRMDQPTWPLKFSVPAAARTLGRHIKNSLLGADEFAGRPRPPGMHWLSLLRYIVAHTNNPVAGIERIHQEHGDIAYAKLPTGNRLFFISQPDLISKILSDTDTPEGGHFEKSELAMGGVAQLTGLGTIFLGLADRWKARRALMAKFLLPTAIRNEAMTERLRALVDEGVDDLERRQLAAGPQGLKVSVSDEMSAMTLRIILVLLFSYGGSSVDLAQQIAPAFHEVSMALPMESLNPFNMRLSDLPLPHPRRPALRSAYKTLDAFAGHILAEGRKRRERKGDLLDALLNASGEDGKPLSDSAIKNEILTMILAGHETTSSTLTWALYSLTRKPEALARLRAEIADDAPSFAQIKDGRYGFLSQVIQETLRLYTPAYMLFRRAKTDVLLDADSGAVFIPEDSHLVLSTFVAHRREEQWGQGKTGYPAARFHPERYDPENIERRGLGKKDLLSFPFGFGPRMCLGQSLSILETQLILIRLLQRFDIIPQHQDKPAHMISGIGVKLEDGFPAFLRPRRPS